MAERDEMKELIRKALDEKGELWVISALVEGSIGYHSPKHAKKLIDAFKRGEEQDYCERCMACFDADLIKMLAQDIRSFQTLERTRPEKVTKIQKLVTKIMDYDEVRQTEIGLLYPTTEL